MGRSGTWVEVVFGHIKIQQGYAGARTMSFDSETTAISQVDTQTADSDSWYNLRGQKIERPTAKGLYILNGKKVMVK